MIPLYRPGRSPLHRLPAGAKLLGLALLAVAVSLFPHTPLSAAVTLAATLGLFLLAGLGVGGWLRQLWATKWIIVLLAVTQAVFLGPETALTGTARVVAVLLLAAVVTMTTPTGDMIEVLQRALKPLRPLGVDPWRAAFTLSLTIAVIPVVASLASQVREAQRARGVRLGPRAIVTLLVLALRHADDMGDALTARGVI
ncbi:energy-coupling factor transporter transmembrane component T family protein [Microbacterium suaedae]|uniref:energy-coupling factor transporter transmembrane component T family protein n=1 Tax=Microbacterium suaedae TaxID=2067813 RepID=UPI000DA15D9B|nr:energy-coupling factor transporter transmembrane protein EcfT [Microbacterium suaedae]